MDELTLKNHLVEKVKEYGSKWNTIEDTISKQHIILLTTITLELLYEKHFIPRT